MFTKKLKIGDLLVIAVVLVLGFLPLIIRDKGKVQEFKIVLDSKIIAEIPTESDTTLIVSAPLGPVKIEVTDGHARVMESNCPEKICVRTGYIERPGQAIACIPNKLLIIAEGERKSEVTDAILE